MKIYCTCRDEWGDFKDCGACDDFDNAPCWCCDGTGLVSPTNLRVPEKYLILGTETCPICEGTGEER